MAVSVQFFGVDKVLEMFEARNVEAWSVYQGKQFMFKGIGADALQTILDAINGTTPIYSLKVYEGIDDPAKIKSSTPDDGSFNFRLQAQGEMNGIPYGLPYNRNAELEKRIAQLEAEKISGSDIDDDENDFSKIVQEEIIGIIQEPNKLLQWKNVLSSIFFPSANTSNYQPMPNRIGNAATTQNQNTMSDETDAQKQKRLIDAINVLEENDPKILDHLEKLAMMAQDNPVKFKGLLSMLEMF